MLRQVSNKQLIERINKVMSAVTITSVISITISILLSIPQFVNNVPSWLPKVLPAIIAFINVFQWIIFLWLITRKNIHCESWKQLEMRCIKNAKPNKKRHKEKHLQKYIIICFITHTVSLITSIFMLLTFFGVKVNPIESYIGLWPLITSVSTVLTIIYTFALKGLLKKINNNQ